MRSWSTRRAYPAGRDQPIGVAGTTPFSWSRSAPVTAGVGEGGVTGEAPDWRLAETGGPAARDVNGAKPGAPPGYSPWRAMDSWARAVRAGRRSRPGGPGQAVAVLVHGGVLGALADPQRHRAAARECLAGGRRLPERDRGDDRVRPGGVGRGRVRLPGGRLRRQAVTQPGPGGGTGGHDDRPGPGRVVPVDAAHRGRAPAVRAVRLHPAGPDLPGAPRDAPGHAVRLLRSNTRRSPMRVSHGSCASMTLTSSTPC